MEPVTVVLGLAAIIGTGALTKIGENMTDRSPQAVNKLFAWMRQRLPQSKTVAALELGQAVDYQQAEIELAPILAEAEGKQLLAEARSAVDANQELRVQLEKAIAKIKSQQLQINRDRSQGYQFNGDVESKFIGGTHYHGVTPD